MSRWADVLHICAGRDIPWAVVRHGGPSSFTQYNNGRTASREDNVPTPKGGLQNNRLKFGKMLSLSDF